MPRINVPLYRQPHPDYCVPACMKMIIDYLRQVYGEKEIPNVPINKIAKQIRTDTRSGGQTTIDNISLINDSLVTSNFCIRFIAKYPSEWKTVLKENEKGNPVIAWIWITDKRNSNIGCGHSVVIIDIDREKGVVTVNDPARGQRNENVVTFISQWENENVDKTLILLEVEKRKQTKLQEFTREDS